MSDKENGKPPEPSGPPVDLNQRLDTSPPPDDKYRCGTLQYTKAGLFFLFSWLIWGGVCFNLFEQQGGTGILSLYLQDNFHVSNLQVNVMFNIIPMCIGTVMTPIVSFKSDRTRTRFGRRIPYILFTAPFLVLFSAAIGFSDDIISFCKVHFAGGTFLSPFTVAMIVVGCLTIGYSFFNEFVGTVFYYIVPDVVPKAFIGRFQGISNFFGQIGNIFINLFIIPFQLTHLKAVHVGLAILYFVSFTLICLRVKEGKYPPVTDVTEKTSFFAQVKLYFRECFSHPIFILFYMSAAIVYLNKGINPAGIFGLHLSQHQATVASGGDLLGMAMSRDGKWLISAGKDGTVQIWSSEGMKTPRLAQTLKPAGGGPASSVALTGDGKKAFIGSSDGAIEAWDALGGKKLHSLVDKGAAVHALALSPDESMLAAAEADGTVGVWDLAKGASVQTLKGHEGDVNAVAFSSDGKKIVSGGSDKKIIVWDAVEGKPVKTLLENPGSVYAVAFAPAIGKPSAESLPLVSSIRRTWDSSIGFLRQVFSNESLYDTPMGKVSCLLGQDEWILSGGRDGATDAENSRLRVWNVADGKCLFALKGHKQAVTSLVYKSDIRSILSGSLDGRVLLWQPWDIGELADDQSFKTFSGYTHGVTAIASIDQGVKMVSASLDGTLHVWDIDQGISLAKGGQRGVFFAIFSLVLAVPAGMLLDKFNPIRLTLFTNLMALPVPFAWYFWYHDYLFGFWTDIYRTPFAMLSAMAGLPLSVMIYPRSKYGQMSSAGAILRQVCAIVGGLSGAILMDYLTARSLNTDAYRYGYLFQGMTASLGLICLFGVYLYWKKLGGENYVAPGEIAEETNEA